MPSMSSWRITPISKFLSASAHRGRASWPLQPETKRVANHARQNILLSDGLRPTRNRASRLGLRLTSAHLVVFRPMFMGLPAVGPSHLHGDQVRQLGPDGDSQLARN